MRCRIHAPYITSFVAQRTGGPVVLVGHSYGGFVITNAATGADNVKALVYVDAFVPDEGENVFQILGGSGSAFDIPYPTVVFDLVGYPGAPEGDAEAFLKPDTVHNSFAQDLPESDRRLIVAGQRPITLSANTTPSGPAAWKSLPSWAVIGTEDRVIPPDTQRRMAERAGATITEATGLSRLDGLAPPDHRRCDPRRRHRGRRLTRRAGIDGALRMPSMRSLAAGTAGRRVRAGLTEANAAMATRLLEPLGPWA